MAVIILCPFFSTASSTLHVGELPVPDYVEVTEDDPTLRVPVIIQYDAWRSSDTPPGRLRVVTRLLVALQLFPLLTFLSQAISLVYRCCFYLL